MLERGVAARRHGNPAVRPVGWIPAAQAGARRHAKRARDTKRADENLLITDGCQQALDLVCKAFLRPGDTVLLENPAYPGALAIFQRGARSNSGRPGEDGSGPRLESGRGRLRDRGRADAESREDAGPHAGFSQSDRNDPAGCRTPALAGNRRPFSSAGDRRPHLRASARARGARSVAEAAGSFESWSFRSTVFRKSRFRECA